MTVARWFGLIAAVLGCSGVAAGAFGAHALRDRLTAELMAVFETAVRYQMYHALALLAVVLAYGRWNGGPLRWSGWLFVAGTIIFSGSLYLLALTRARWWGAVTPVGGLCLLAGWALLAWGIAAGTR